MVPYSNIRFFPHIVLQNHGYDNDEISMQAIFVAHGPFSFEAKVQHQKRNKYAPFRRSLKHDWHSTSDDTYIMQRFQNVEVYNLVIKLLGIDASAASNNGTVGFWDRYL